MSSDTNEVQYPTCDFMSVLLSYEAIKKMNSVVVNVNILHWKLKNLQLSKCFKL